MISCRTHHRKNRCLVFCSQNKRSRGGAIKTRFWHLAFDGIKHGWYTKWCFSDFMKQNSPPDRLRLVPKPGNELFSRYWPLIVRKSSFCPLCRSQLLYMVLKPLFFLPLLVFLQLFVFVCNFFLQYFFPIFSLNFFPTFVVVVFVVFMIKLWL